MTPPTTLTARCTDDLLAMAPVVLGFAPTDSVVLLTFGADRPFHARVDLPDEPAHDAGIVEMLLAPARHHRVRGAALLTYAGSGRAADARRVGGRLVRALRRAGIEVVDAVRADGERWFALFDPVDPGVPYDLTGHRFTAQAVLDGRPLRRDRDELVATLRPTAGVDAVDALLGSVRRLDLAEVRSAVETHLAGGRLPDDVLAAVLLSIADPAVRDAAWTGIRRRTALQHVRLWTDAVRRAPEPVRGSAAAVLALAAWAAGDGALAWCAVDRCRAVDPANTLADLVADGLQRAVPPDVLDTLP